MPKKTRSFRSWQLKELTDPERAEKYLNVSAQDSKEVLLAALGKVAQAHRMTHIARETGIQRETLYRSLSEDGNPTYDTFSSVLAAVGLCFEFKRIKKSDSDESGNSGESGKVIENAAPIQPIEAQAQPVEQHIPSEHERVLTQLLFSGQIANAPMPEPKPESNETANLEYLMRMYGSKEQGDRQGFPN